MPPQYWYRIALEPVDLDLERHLLPEDLALVPWLAMNEALPMTAAVKPSMFRTAKEAHKRYSAQMGSADPRDVSALAALVQRVVDESGDPVGFDALAWTTRWLHRPVPALGGACPVEYMATPEGRALVETLLMRMQSGAYS